MGAKVKGQGTRKKAQGTRHKKQEHNLMKPVLVP